MNYLNPTYYYDFEDKSVQKLIQEFQTNKLSLKEKAIGIYLKDYGYFEDVPVDFILDNFKENYPEIMNKNKGLTEIII